MTILFSLFVSLAAEARPVYWNSLQSYYTGAQITIRCQSCHQSGGPQLNLYGRDFVKARSELGTPPIAEVFAWIDRWDSDQDTVDNGTEFRSGRNPGRADPLPGNP